jgi:hypothetical protein
VRRHTFERSTRFTENCLWVKSQLRTKYHEQPRTKGRHFICQIRVGRIEHHDRCLSTLVLVYFGHRMGSVSSFWVSGPKETRKRKNLQFALHARSYASLRQ